MVIHWQSPFTSTSRSSRKHAVCKASGRQSIWNPRRAVLDRGSCCHRLWRRVTCPPAAAAGLLLTWNQVHPPVPPAPAPTPATPAVSLAQTRFNSLWGWGRQRCPGWAPPIQHHLTSPYGVYLLGGGQECSHPSCLPRHRPRPSSHTLAG